MIEVTRMFPARLCVMWNHGYWEDEQGIGHSDPHWLARMDVIFNVPSPDGIVPTCFGCDAKLDSADGLNHYLIHAMESQIRHEIAHRKLTVEQVKVPELPKAVHMARIHFIPEVKQ